MAVYTEVTDEDLARFLGQYDIGQALSCKGIAEGVENSNYLLQTEQGSFILTLYEKRVNPDDLPFFISLMRHLADRGIPCPTPVPGQDGEALRELCGRPAAIISFLTGMSPRRISVNHCAGVGAALGDMHKAGADFPVQRRNSLTVGDWRPLFEACDGRADEICPGLNDEISQELDIIERSWPASGGISDVPMGVIHADLFPDNIFFISNSLSGIIDFYFACTDFLAYDIAICLNAWCFEQDRSFNVTKARRLLQSYCEHRPLNEEERALLPLFARGSAMRFLLTRLYDWLNQPEGALVRPKDPMEYVRKLRFHRGISGPGDYGL